MSKCQGLQYLGGQESPAEPMGFAVDLEEQGLLFSEKCFQNAFRYYENQ